MQNYLSAKWGTTLTAGDRYLGDDGGNGDYDEDVFGIGREDSASVISGTYGTGLALTELNGSLSNTEYVLAGHNVINNGLTTDDVANNVVRSERVWYLDETGSVDARLTFDLSEADLTTPGFVGQWVLLYSEDEPFDFEDLGLVASISGDQVSFDLTSLLLVDGYYTLAFAPVPEPGSWQMLALGAAGLTVGRRKSRRSRCVRIASRLATSRKR